MTAQPQEWFDIATDAVLELIASTSQEHWQRPALGSWTVIELIAHTIRAWTTVTEYLDSPPPATHAEIVDAGRYFAVGLTMPGIHDGVADRARAEAAGLADPEGAARAAAAAARTSVAAATDDRVLVTRIAPMTLADYLRTRAFELTVHGIDLVRATRVPVPSGLAQCAVPALALCSEIAGQRDLAMPLLLAASGRAPLPAEFTILA